MVDMSADLFVQIMKAGYKQTRTDFTFKQHEITSELRDFFFPRLLTMMHFYIVGKHKTGGG